MTAPGTTGNVEGQLPTVALERVWHVGTLDRRDKGCRGPSYEGAGLSVSPDPHVGADRPARRPAALDPRADGRGGEVEERSIAAAPPALPEATRQRSAGHVVAWDLLLPVWEERATDLDGLWWDDVDAPGTFTAPRGVIVAPRVPCWGTPPVPAGR